MLFVCERWFSDGDKLLHIDSKVLLTIAVLLLDSGQAAQPRVTEGPSSLSGAGSHSAGILSPNSTTSTGQGDIPISSTGCTCFAVLPFIYTAISLDWRLGQGSICYKDSGFTSYPSRPEGYLVKNLDNNYGKL